MQAVGGAMPNSLHYIHSQDVPKGKKMRVFSVIVFMDGYQRRGGRIILLFFGQRKLISEMELTIKDRRYPSGEQ